MNICISVSTAKLVSLHSLVKRAKERIKKIEHCFFSSSSANSQTFQNQRILHSFTHNLRSEIYRSSTGNHGLGLIMTGRCELGQMFRPQESPIRLKLNPKKSNGPECNPKKSLFLCIKNNVKKIIKKVQDSSCFHLYSFIIHLSQIVGRLQSFFQIGEVIHFYNPKKVPAKIFLPKKICQKISKTKKVPESLISNPQKAFAPPHK